MRIIPTVHPAVLLRGGHPITEIIRRDLGKAWRLAHEDPDQYENLVIAHPANPVGLAATVQMTLGWLQRWQSIGCTVAVDVETSSLNFFNCSLYSIALSGEDGCNTAVAFTLKDLRTLPWDAEQALLLELDRLLSNPRVSKLFHNAPYDFAVLTRKGFTIAGQIEDTQAYAHLYQPDIPKDLGFVGHTWLDVEPWKLNHQTGQKQAYTRDVLELLIYNAKDALNTMKLRNPLLSACADHGCSAELISYQNAFARLAAHMEIIGLPINFELRRKMGAELLTRLDELRARMREYLQWPEFNPMNKNHAVKALYDKRHVGLMPTAWTEKTQQPSTKYEHIIDHMQHPFVKDFVEYVENHHSYATQYREDPPGAYSRAVQDDGRLHPKWNPTGQKGSRFSSEPNCFCADTEVLTELGWLPFPEARELAARPFQYDPEMDSASLAPTAEYVKTESAWWVHLQTEAIDHLSTANHRILVEQTVQRRCQKVRALATVPAIELKTRCFNQGALRSRAGFLQAIGVDIAPALITVLCACQADGWRRRYGKGEAWSFYFAKQRKVRRLVEALSALGCAADWYQKPLRRGAREQTAIYLRDCPVKTKIDQWLGHDKRFGPWLLEWSGESLRQFVDELTQWDGRAGRRSEYSTTAKENADWAQAAAVLSGARAGSVREFWGSHSKRPCYQLSRGWKKPVLGFSRKHVTECSYDQPREAYCVTVPTGYIFVRRGGKACISGNCQNQRPKDRAFFEAPEGRVFVGADKDALELRLAAVFSGVAELIHEMTRPGGDPHRLAAINIYGEPFLKKSADEQKALRDAVKTTVYASLYRAGVKTVHKSIRKKKFLDPALRSALTLEVVEHICTSYFGKYVEIPVWHDRNYALAQSQYYLECPPFGRRRYFPVQPPPYTEVANWIIQTAGSDVVGMEMVQIQDELQRRYHGEANIVLHGHDAVYVECADHQAVDVAKLVNKLFGATPMQGPAGPLALTATAKICRNLRFDKKKDQIVTVPREA